MNRSTCLVLGVGLITGCGLRGQSNPLSADVKSDYTRIRDYVLKSAEKMSEANYAFRPTAEVRTFGQIIAHIADDQYNICAMAKGETRHAAYSEIEETLSTKAELVAALKLAFTYCDGAYDAMTDAAAAEIVTSGKVPKPKLVLLTYNTWHTVDT